MMLRALAESRERQARLVTDAGHELRTPLTSLRTNVELLMASMAPGAPRLPENEMAGLRTDVIAQIEELSTLVGDLVDLTRDDAGGVCMNQSTWPKSSTAVSSGFAGAVTTLNSTSNVVPWQVYGERPGCRGRCSICWTTRQNGVRPAARVGVRLAQVDPSHAELVVADHGPGIPPQERQLVFERFYRSASARAMPGSGLGLAIVKQVVIKHGGTCGSRIPCRGVSRRGRRFMCAVAGGCRCRHHGMATVTAKSLCRNREGRSQVGSQPEAAR